MMTGFERYTKKTRRAMFLEEMEQVVPWAKLCALIEPHYPRPGNGRRPKELEQMLRIYFLQQWFNLADPAVEEALYDSGTLRQFAGIDLGSEPVPDETTVCKFPSMVVFAGGFLCISDCVAERGGFEPSVQFPPAKLRYVRKLQIAKRCQRISYQTRRQSFAISPVSIRHPFEPEGEF